MLRENVFNRTIELVGEHYVFEDVARNVADRLRSNISIYAAVKTDNQFAAALTRDMFEVSKDVHLTLMVRPKGNQDRNVPPVAISKFLEDGINLIKISRFPSVHALHGETAVHEIDQAFLLAERARGLIIDLRNNLGGDGSSVALATSYLIPPQPRLLAFYRYRTNMPDGQSWTWEKLPHEVNGTYRPLADKPICVLINKTTFSAAEEFVYNLQQLKRARIVGERTKGGAHPSKRHLIDGSFLLSIPFAETINPISNSNWEGVGIIPDVECLSRDAVKVALGLLAK